jgi:hypothetical protein
VEVDNPNDWLEAVANGNGVALASGALDIYRRPDVVYRRLLDAQPTELAVATRRDPRSEIAEEFLRACRESFGSSAEP